MRTCVVGGGLAGVMLAWRLARAAGPGGTVDLVRGARVRADATAASGGAVRAYEVDPRLRRLAAASLAELLASPVLRRWSGYRPVESVYLTAGGARVADLAGIERALPGAAELVGAGELARHGWAGLPAGAVAVREPRAGYVAPDRWRDAVLADRAVRRRVRLRVAALTGLTVRPGGTVGCRIGDRWRGYDTVVLATGPWTPGLLARLGWPADGWRTKSIQYAVHRVDGWRPPIFVDELRNVYGRPHRSHELLLGTPTDQWGVDPDQPPAARSGEAAALAGSRFPALRIGPVVRMVSAVDCYGSHPTLSLQPVTPGCRLFTFTGGAGGSVKTVLAASGQAAAVLTGSGEHTASDPTAPRESQP